MSQIQFPVMLPGSSSFTAVLQDNNGTPTNVLEAALDFTIHVEWKVSAPMALVLGGEFEVKAYSEPIGPGPAPMQIGSTATVTVNGGQNYAVDLLVKGGTFQDLDPTPPPNTSGAYKIITMLAHRNFGKYTDVSAIAESATVRIG